MEAKKKLILKAGGLFLAALILMTFFSRTIYNLSLPSVVVEYPREGAITRSAEADGSVDFVLKDSYHADIAGKIYLLAAPGQQVEAGSELYAIVTNMEELEQAMEEYTRLNLRLEKARTDQSYAQRDAGGEYDTEIARLEISVAAAQKELDDTRALFEAGAIAQKDLDEKQAALDDLKLQYQRQYDNKQQALGNRDKNVRDLQYQIEEYEAEMASQRKEIDRLEEQMGAQGKTTVLAENAGIVRQLGAGVENGSHVTKDDLVMRIGVSSEGYKAIFDLPESVGYLKIGNDVTLNVKSREIFGLSGMVSGIMMDNGRAKVEVQFEAEGLGGGETAEIRVHDTSDLYENLLPNSAIRSDSNGEFVLYAEMVKGVWGAEYYAKRAYTSIRFQDENTSAVWLYNNARLPIIINSDKAIAEGDRIRIVGGSDLVEIR